MPKKIWYLAFLSGLLLTLPWYNILPGYILLLAFVPLLIVENYIYERKNIFSSRSVFFIAYLAFFTWNLCTLWWVVKISYMGALFCISANSMFYAAVFWSFHLVKRVTGTVIGWLAFIFFLLAFEFYSLHSEFALPWLILGNGLANCIQSIQWYEYTGTQGGSLWILLSNILLFSAYQYWRKQNYTNLFYVLFLALVLWFVPHFLSTFIYNHYCENGIPCKVAIIQPNIDPYIEKFNTLSQNEQLGRILTLADSLNDKEINYYLAPETAIDNDIWENALWNNYSLFTIRNFLSTHPNSCFVIGAITYREYQNNEEKKATTRYNPSNKLFFDVFNSALQLDTSFNTPIYHKSKLVLGVEKVPFPGIFHFFDQYMLHLGGSSGSLGQQDEPSVFCGHGSYKPAPVICYESIYGEYNAKFIQKGANLLFIITNDGWWGGTPGYMQHLRYAQLRAVEIRRSVARCANTGISAFINQKGEIMQSSVWWEQTAMIGNIRTNNRMTFYAKHGDYIGRIAVIIAMLIILFTVAFRYRKIKQNKKNARKTVSSLFY
jgi:apolipoprotein N-acyltransferase